MKIQTQQPHEQGQQQYKTMETMRNNMKQHETAIHCDSNKKGRMGASR